MKTGFVTAIIMFIFADSAIAQKYLPGSSLIGTWKGTSICQIKNSPCHDEIVVYYISKAKGNDTFSIKANKIVNGKEEEMGIIGFKLDSKNNRLLSTDYNSVWTLNFKDENIDGTLYNRGNLYRIIKLKKQH